MLWDVDARSLIRSLEFPAIRPVFAPKWSQTSHGTPRQPHSAAQSVRAFPASARRAQPDFGAASLWRFAGLGGARASPDPEPGTSRLAGGAAGAERRRGAAGGENARLGFFSSGGA